ncbi:MAG: hypothetical protein A3H67_03795 [Candidatus Buchananbacteria bacterium RIFCSPLOWO2_02_FULL_46_11b]|uniref:Divalent-cation tolerance protein CutA n=1 Tax=Candidatus Buchananbacteria bacterium RIFCSPLOWO2_02_FULL_46_11b TaxID=1797548 RepID=A0A1G1YYE9_9BACT|nr:MAG: hypothetical protein A3H67_03795 [Candidatus Buchananbacteria bacterium RIFCSPLOWO2_02_FULL_46_11b]
MILVYTTHKNQAAAEKVAIYLLKKRLVACVNFFPVSASYLWRGQIKNEKETAALFKTKKENWRKVKKEIEKIHPDEAPCVIKLTAEANKLFESWIKKEIK